MSAGDAKSAVEKLVTNFKAKAAAASAEEVTRAAALSSLAKFCSRREYRLAELSLAQGSSCRSSLCSKC